VVKIQVKVFWVVTPCVIVVGYQRFRRPCSPYLHPEGRVSMDFQIVGIKPQHYTASQHRRPWLGDSGESFNFTLYWFVTSTL